MGISTVSRYTHTIERDMSLVIYTWGAATRSDCKAVTGEIDRDFQNMATPPQSLVKSEFRVRIVMSMLK